MNKNRSFVKFVGGEELIDKVIDDFFKKENVKSSDDVAKTLKNSCKRSGFMTIDEVLNSLQLKTEELPPRAQICEEAAKLINGDRNKSYGDPSINLKAAQIMTNDFLTSYYESGKDMTQADNAWLNAMQNVFIKLGRIATGEFKKDSYADCIGYLGIAYELALKAQQEKEKQNGTN